MKKQHTINLFGAIIAVSTAAFACYLLYDAVGIVVDTKELFFSSIFFVLCFVALFILKRGNSKMLIFSGIVLLLFVGFVFYRYEYLHRAGTAIALQGDIVFQPSQGESSPSAICFFPIRTPHWYETGIEVDFFESPTNFPNALAQQKLIKSGAAKLIKKEQGYNLYRVNIPRKLFREWKD